MCHKCDEKEKVIDEMCNKMNDVLKMGEGIISHEEAIAFLIGTATGIAHSHKLNKEEFIEIIAEVYSAANDAKSARESGLH